MLWHIYMTWKLQPLLAGNFWATFKKFFSIVWEIFAHPHTHTHHPLLSSLHCLMNIFLSFFIIFFIPLLSLLITFFAFFPLCILPTCPLVGSFFSLSLLNAIWSYSFFSLLTALSLSPTLSPYLLPPSGRQKAFKDTSQYVVGELSALESEQRHIDARAARVEKRLRYLMDTGSLGPITLEKLFWQIERVHARTHAHTHTHESSQGVSMCVFMCFIF